jgi:hypothetical protein
MKYPFICLASLTMLFAACKKEEGTPAPVVPVTKYVQSIIADNGDSTAVEFNIDKSVYKFLIFGGDKSFFAAIPSYESGTANLTKVEVTTDPISYNTYVQQIITYNSLKEISTISVYNDDKSLAGVDSLVYGATGKPDTIYYYEQQKLLKRYVQTWDVNGNLVQQEVTDKSADIADASIITTYTYDKKINPRLKVPGFNIINFDKDQLAVLLSANNVLTSSSVNGYTEYTSSSNNTYTYDVDDYPTVMTSKSQSQYIGQELQKDSVTLKFNYGK